MYLKTNYSDSSVQLRAVRLRWISLPIAAMILVMMAACGLATASAATASAPLPWAQRPPTLDPTYGLPVPASFRRPQAIPAWIWTAITRNHQIVYLRHTFTLKAVPHQTELYATADNHLEVFINGRKITDTFHRKNEVWKRVRRLAVGRFLRPGRNIIAVRAQNNGGPAGVLVWIRSGDHTLCRSGRHWRVAYRVAAGTAWENVRFDDSHWPHATIIANYGSGPWGANISPWPGVSYLVHLYFQPMHVTVLHDPSAFKGLSSVPAELTPANIAAMRPQYDGRSLLAPAHSVQLRVTPSTTESHPELLISFGEEVAGRIEVQGSGGTVSIGTGESKGEALHGPWGGVHTLNLADGDIQSTPWSAFRYATVSFSGRGPIDIKTLRLDFKYYPVQYRGAFACSDPLLTKLWYTGAYTAHLCMQEQIWDAPKRDRAMWMGDLQVSGQVINNIFLDRFLMELTMRELRQAVQGGQPATALPATYVNNIPGYSDAWICGLADFYRHTGAIGYIRSQHQLLLSMLRYMRQGFNRKNIFTNKHDKWCFVDWAPQLNGATPQADMATDLYTCWAVQRAVSLLKAMGDTANAAKYAYWDQQLIHAARRYLVDPKTHTYTNLRQVNAMAIDAHVADARQRRAIYRQILAPSCPSWKQIATPYYNNFVLFAVGHLGHTLEGLNFARKYWGGMIREGATTFWEHYDPSWPKKHFHLHLNDDVGNGYAVSLCHGWSTGVTNWLTEHVLGVKPRSGGFARTVIVPHLGDLRWASGRVPTPHGNIVISVKAKHEADSIRLTLPPGIRTLVGVRGRSVTVNGHPATIARRSAKRCYIELSHGGVFNIVGRS